VGSAQQFAIAVRQVRNENLQFCQRYIAYQLSLSPNVNRDYKSAMADGVPAMWV
jgi:hypothetical protein